VEVDLFSGRPNPQWHLTPERTASLIAELDRLPRSTDSMPIPAALGYRGCSLTASDGPSWRAYGGLIVAVESGEQRVDVDRGWERELLATAPPGVLPPRVI
jgi:hypothetical protein